MNAIHEVIKVADPSHPPRLSAILAICGEFASGAKALRLLGEQTVAGDLELILVSESPTILSQALPRLAPFACFQLILGETTRLPSLRAEAAMFARSPVSAFCEDHSFLEPSWAAALLDSFAAPRVVAAAPAFINPNPRHPLSRVLFAAHFGPWAAANWTPAQHPRPSLPWHNTAYRRADLLELGPAVAELLAVECHLQDAVKRLHPDGIFILNATTATHHANASRLASAFRHALVGGRMFAGERWTRGGWSRARRLLQAAATPGIPLLRMWRSRTDLIRAANGPGDTLRILAYAWVVAIVHATGELVGNLLGAGDFVATYSNFECRRARFVQPQDLAILHD
jgi:hypothetical protein